MTQNWNRRVKLILFEQNLELGILSRDLKGKALFFTALVNKLHHRKDLSAKNCFCEDSITERSKTKPRT